MTKTPRKTIKIIVGAIALALILGAILLTFRGQELLTGAQAKYEVEFDNVLNLVPNSSTVRVEGVTVGTVSAKSQEEETGVAEIAIDHDIDIRADASAKLRLQSILGQMYIELDPGTASEPLAGPIPTKRTEGATDLSGILEDTGPTVEGLDADEVTETLEFVSETTDKYTVGGGETIAQTAATLDNLVKNQADLFGIITQTENLTTTLVEQTRRLELITADAQATIDSVRAFAATQGPRMLAILDDLLTLRAVFDRNMANIQSVLDQTPALLGLTRVLVNQLVANITAGEFPAPVALDGLGPALAKDRLYPNAPENP